jgi:membrane protease subunit HflC
MGRAMLHGWRPWLILAVLAVLGVLSSAVVVPETQQAVVLNLGQPVEVINRYRPGQRFGGGGAGLHWRIPLIEQLVRIDKRVLAVDMSPSLQVLSNDRQLLDVDAYARLRVTDPERMVRTAGTTEKAVAQIQPILASVIRQTFGGYSLQALLTPERGAAIGQIRDGLGREARAYGLEVVDVGIRRAALPEGAPLDYALSRMQAARQQQAAEIKAQGERDGLLVQADAEAQADKIYADSFGKDPGFYDFYRAMRSYETVFANPQTKGGTTIVLSPDNEYLRQFRGGKAP